MTNETNQVLVLRDEEGAYYRLSREVLEASRVPEEEKANLEETLSDDTGGFFMPIHMGSVWYAYSVSRPADSEPPGQMNTRSISQTH